MPRSTKNGAQYYFGVVLHLLIISAATEKTVEESYPAGEQSCRASDTAHIVDHVGADASADFAAYIASRRPLMAVGGCNSTARTLAVDELKRMYGPADIIITAIPPTFVDPRPSNILGMGFWREGMSESIQPTTCDYFSTVSGFIRFIHLPANKRRGPKKWRVLPREQGCHNHPMHQADPVWKGTHLYWRSSLPSDGKYDELGPKLFAHMKDTLGIFEGNSPVAGPGWSADKHYLRAGSGNYTYPLHMDCYPNLLYNYWGEKEVLMYDLKAFWRRHSNRIFEMFNPTSIAEMLTAMPDMKEHVYSVTLKPGDVLYIPVLWMHEAKYKQPGFGSNHFYRHPAHKDIALCEFVKGGLPSSLNGGVLSERDIFKATKMSMKKNAPGHHSEYSKRLGVRNHER